MLVKWRATFAHKDSEDMQMTIEFEAPEFSENWNYKLLAKLAFIQQITFGENIVVNNVEPIEIKEE
tara:strand:+ start:379 stop:576 length:198 start_codon:yes stop_codon:yes gene_type:complete